MPVGGEVAAQKKQLIAQQNSTAQLAQRATEMKYFSSGSFTLFQGTSNVHQLALVLAAKGTPNEE